MSLAVLVGIPRRQILARRLNNSLQILTLIQSLANLNLGLHGELLTFIVTDDELFPATCEQQTFIILQPPRSYRNSQQRHSQISDDLRVQHLFQLAQYPRHIGAVQYPMVVDEANVNLTVLFNHPKV